MKYVKLVPSVFLFAYAAKYLILQANPIDAGIVAILALFAIGSEILQFKLKVLKSDDELNEIREKLKEIEKSNNEIKSHFSHVQLGNQIKFNGKR